jgi:hypothetical protein
MAPPETLPLPLLLALLGIIGGLVRGRALGESWRMNASGEAPRGGRLPGSKPHSGGRSDDSMLHKPACMRVHASEWVDGGAQKAGMHSPTWMPVMFKFTSNGRHEGARGLWWMV